MSPKSPNAAKKPLGAEEAIPNEWKLVGEAGGLVLTLFKATERSDVEAQLERLLNDGYYRDLKILGDVAAPPRAPVPRAAKTMPVIGASRVSPRTPNPSTVDAVTIYCSQCGESMRVARMHVNRRVACPHCQTPLEPWRVVTPVAAPPPVGAAPYAAASSERFSPRSKVLAGVLGIILGGLGVHRFYLGYIGIGIIQIIVTVLTGGVGSVWGLVEGILCLTGHMRDADGLPLRD